MPSMGKGRGWIVGCVCECIKAREEAIVWRLQILVSSSPRMFLSFCFLLCLGPLSKATSYLFICPYCLFDRILIPPSRALDLKSALYLCHSYHFSTCFMCKRPVKDHAIHSAAMYIIYSVAISRSVWPSPQKTSVVGWQPSPLKPTPRDKECW